jgi:predicted ester cyclase
MVQEAVNERRFELLDELCALALAERFRQAFAEFLAAFPDWRQEIVDLIAEGDRVMVHCTCSGTQRGPFIGQPATGKHMEQVHEVFIFRVQDDRLTDVWSLEDTWDRMQQLGHHA